ncbi:hypothetical protein F5B21DRAFT_64964 [Xylaria acuta]|nr:hypothetical protein F5B21DRAFT_64964 [Xylaria acuta]
MIECTRGPVGDLPGSQRRGPSHLSPEKLHSCVRSIAERRALLLLLLLCVLCRTARLLLAVGLVNEAAQLITISQPSFREPSVCLRWHDRAASSAAVRDLSRTSMVITSHIIIQRCLSNRRVLLEYTTLSPRMPHTLYIGNGTRDVSKLKYVHTSDPLRDTPRCK